MSDKESKNYTFLSALAELLSSKYDDRPTKNERYAEQLRAVHEEFVTRNKKLTALLDDFIIQRGNRVKTNDFLKKFIFWFFVFMLGILTVAVAVFVVCNITVSTMPAVISLVSVSFTYLASLIAVFEIMSKYLFPVDEEKDTISMIKAVIANDIQVEEIMSKAIDRSNQDEIQRLQSYKKLLDDQAITKEEYDELKKKLIKKL